MIIVTILIFILLLFIGMPISLVLIISSLSYLLLTGNLDLLNSVPQQMFSGINNSGLLAIPLFMLAGELMNSGGITTRLITFSKSIIGHLRGGLAYVAVIANMFLASILGSANAQAAMMSKVMVPEMEREGYDRGFASALTLSSSIVAPVIPPSMLFIIYGTLSGASIGTLFLAGIVPGVMLGLSFMLIIIYLSKKNNFPKSERPPVKEMTINFFQVIPALLIPFIIIFGILSGIFTPTESAAVACILAVILGFSYKQLKIKNIPEILKSTAISTAVITFLIVMANVFGFILAFERIPQLITETMLSLSENPIVFLLLVNILLLLLGTVLDGIAALIILVPVFTPLLPIYDVDPVHFGVIITINLTIGLMTPPVGTGLFIVSSIAKVTLERLLKSMFPFLVVAIIMLLVITYWEDAILWIPNLYSE
ncbi:TRAP transporter large permease [Salinicoccus halitifaciens]|uniref:Tripartite ATP-independent transporter DctM subunit n=1 Tax=Salinicoccus halitifaciens TaxID=1073415 RepID=A0ABV2E7X6_9STAP|nr:TRAP transporter large permease [Salinicoccus halitifaciens]MCD2136414.1 TRAP transporter large permease [Salinicoccus halitifaciens]